MRGISGVMGIKRDPDHIGGDQSGVNIRVSV